MPSDTASEVLSIQALLSRYGNLLDAHEMERFAELWAPDAELTIGRATTRGRDEIAARCAEAVKGLHLGGIPDIEVSGDRATGVQSFLFVALEDHQLILGRYEDSYVRVDGTWLFASRRIVFLRPPAK